MLWTMESGHTDYSSQDALQYVFPLSSELGWIPDVEDVDLWCPIPLVRTHYSELKQRQGRRLLRRSHDSTPPPPPHALPPTQSHAVDVRATRENMKKEKFTLRQSVTDEDGLGQSCRGSFSSSRRG